ncbi:5a5bfac9-4fe6-4371-ba2e-0029c58b289d [Thermothielavioides terrestris]|nr:5a5bfac9-4fe6-4371-ba2e-0029c58b289d [Thermothielavioides terrestris]
MFELVG